MQPIKEKEQWRIQITEWKNKKEISWERAMAKVEPTGNLLHFVGRWNRDAHMVLDEAYYLMIMKKDGKHFERCWEVEECQSIS